ncbi:MAG: glycosyltransferase [Nitrososphaeria archaeon]
MLEKKIRNASTSGLRFGEIFSLNVGIFSPTFSIFGGGELVAATIANTLAENNYNARLFTYGKIYQRELKKYFGKRLHPSIEVVVTPSFIRSNELLSFYQNIFRSYYFKSKCDIWIDVYSNCILPWTNIDYIHFPLLNHYFFKPKFPYIKGRDIKAIGVLPYIILEKYIANNMEKLVLANSCYTAAEIEKFYGIKAKVLYPPVSSINFNIAYSARTQRKNIVVSISRFAYSKQLDKILYVALATPRDIRFVIMGRVHNRDALSHLQKLIKKFDLIDRMTLFPNISRFKMLQILKSAKVYLHTTVGEHFGISIAEAMASGCIPIVHDSGGPKEFVPEEFRYKDIKEAAIKVAKEIYEWSPSKSRRMTKIAERFRDKQFSANFLKLFENYIENFL